MYDTSISSMYPIVEIVCGSGKCSIRAVKVTPLLEYLNLEHTHNAPCCITFSKHSVIILEKNDLN